MFRQLLLISTLLLVRILPSHGRQTYHIDDLCPRDATIHVGTETIYLHITTDFTKYTRCDVLLEFTDKKMRAKMESIPVGSVVDCGWLTAATDNPVDGFKHDWCYLHGGSWNLNQFGGFDYAVLLLDGRERVKLRARGVNHTFGIFGYYTMCNMPTDSCSNTKDVCVEEDCWEAESRNQCQLRCNMCDGKFACCDGYGKMGENTDSVHVCVGLGGSNSCIHKNMVCDNYTNCVDATDEMCDVTTPATTVMTTSSGGEAQVGVVMGVVAIVGQCRW